MSPVSLPPEGAPVPLQVPPALVTGIGSLPCRDPQTAVPYVAQACPLLPFWPELPFYAPQSRMVEQVCRPLADLLRPVPALPEHRLALDSGAEALLL
ncbi:MAG: hypothetical protein AB7N91_19445 [Candidatus Tectimicrobiota bacterium]